MASRSKIAGKMLVAAACAAAFAQVPISSASAYSFGYEPVFAATTGVANSDYARDGIVASDGSFVVIGHAETVGSADQVYVVKVGRNGQPVWSKIFGTAGQVSYGDNIIELVNGNYLISARIDGSSNTTLVELDKDTGNVVTHTDTSFRLLDIALDDSEEVGYIWGVDGQDRIMILANTDNLGYGIISSSNIQDGIPIHSIRQVEDDGFIALGFDEDNNSTIIYRQTEAQTYPSIKTYSGTGITLNDIAVDSDGNYIGVGYTTDNKPVISKIGTNGSEIKRYVVEGTNATGFYSSFSSVDILDNGDIVASGISGYSNSTVIDVNNPQDGFVARFTKDLTLVEVDSDFGGNGNIDALSVARADGNNYYVAGWSNSTDIGVNDVHEAFSIVSRYEKIASVDVDFNISGDIPDGVDVPEDGTYHWKEDGTNDLPHPGNTDDEIFSGWYTDEDMTKDANDSMPTDDTDLYGTYTTVGHDVVDQHRDTMCEITGIKMICTSPDTTEVVEGETSDPIAPQVPSDIDTEGLTGKWVSDDESIAKVDQNGRVTGVSEGTTTIRYILTDEDGNVIYEYVMTIAVKGAVNPDTFDKGTVSAFTAAGAAIGGLTAVFATIRRFFGRK